jgi:hypothetical protein
LGKEKFKYTHLIINEKKHLSSTLDTLPKGKINCDEYEEKTKCNFYFNTTNIL